jgi:ribosome recycling factor
VTHEALVSIEPKMQRAVEAMERDFAGIRTGRASTALVERLMVDYYGTPTPINQVAGISVPDAHLIVIQPWDRSVLSAIERAITKSDIGLVANVDGTVVRLNVPPLTEERRHELVKQVRRRTEDARVEVRNHRREAADQLKKALRGGSLSEDEEHRELENLQRLTDRYVEAIDARADRKEAEVLEV